MLQPVTINNYTKFYIFICHLQPIHITHCIYAT